MLAEWESFYVIVGSSSGVLIGLMFVVITLGSDRTVPTDEEAFRAFGTPTIVHFGIVLLIAGLLTMPGQTRFSLHLCLVATSLWGIGYVVRAFILARRQKSYAPVSADWTWHIALPLAAYLFLFATGFAIAEFERMALYGVAVTALGLLYIGIHNAWDSAVYIATQRGSAAQEKPDDPTT